MKDSLFRGLECEKNSVSNELIAQKKPLKDEGDHYDYRPYEHMQNPINRLMYFITVPYIDTSLI